MALSDAEKLTAAMRELNEMRALTISLDMAERGESAFVIFEALLAGIRQVDERYEAGEYYIADLIMAGHIMRSVMDTALVFPGEYSRSMGRVVICTVQGDIHDLGKQVVIELLEYNGFEVFDLGVDAAPEAVAEAVRRHAPNILVLSGTLAGSVRSMRAAIRAVERSGLRKSLRILVGGAAVADVSPRVLGADAKGASVLDSLRICHEFMALAAGEPK